MDIWDYDRKTGVLLGRSAADPNPEEPGNWIIPAYATTVRPPFVPEGCVAIFNGGLRADGEWRIELAYDQICGLGPKERAALSALINSYVGDRKDREGVRRAVMAATEDLIDRAAITGLPTADLMLLRDQVRSLVQSLINTVN
jgi:hypothetical protein